MKGSVLLTLLLCLTGSFQWCFEKVSTIYLFTKIFSCFPLKIPVPSMLQKALNMQLHRQAHLINSSVCQSVICINFCNEDDDDDGHNWSQKVRTTYEVQSLGLHQVFRWIYYHQIQSDGHNIII